MIKIMNFEKIFIAGKRCAERYDAQKAHQLCSELFCDSYESVKVWGLNKWIISVKAAILKKYLFENDNLGTGINGALYNVFHNIFPL